MYSLISMRTMLFSSSKRLAARDLASSVLPTPVGPRNRKEPMGLEGSLMPALERMMASVTLVTPKKEDDRLSKERLADLQKELAEEKESFASRKAQWDNEKTSVEKLSKLREERR